MRNEEAIFTLSKTRALNAPIPLQTDTYSPVSHAQIVDEIKRMTTRNNLEIIRDRFHSNSFGTRVVGFMTIEDHTDIGKENGLKMMLAYRNSYDKSMSVAFAAGANVWICGNGLIGGDLMAFRRKHTGTVATELQEKIQTGINSMKSDFGRLNMEVDVMKNYALTPRQKAEIMGILYFERNLISPTQLSIVKHEIRNSENFKENNAWHLYNNVTEALKKSHPIEIISDHINLHNFMKEMTGMNIEPEIPNAEPSVEG